MANKEPLNVTDNTVIGPSILISGKLTGDEDLTVRGRVEGELTLSKTLIVEPSGIVKANVAVKNAIVSGVVVGNINATESVELTKEGRMVGDIRAPRVIIVDGASFRGRVDMGEVEPGRVSERPARPVVRPAAVAKPTVVSRPPPPPARPEAQGWLTRFAMSPRFHRLAARMPGLRGLVRREGAELFRVISGFVQSQALVALVEARVLHFLASGPMTTEEMSRRVAVPEAPLEVLLRAGAALKLVARDRKGLWVLAPRGAAFLAVRGWSRWCGIIMSYTAIFLIHWRSSGARPRPNWPGSGPMSSGRWPGKMPGLRRATAG